MQGSITASLTKWFNNKHRYNVYLSCIILPIILSYRYILHIYINFHRFQVLILYLCTLPLRASVYYLLYLCRHVDKMDVELPDIEDTSTQLVQVSMDKNVHVTCPCSNQISLVMHHIFSIWRRRVHVCILHLLHPHLKPKNH